MITPRFRLLQDDMHITFIIKAPYCSLRKLDVLVSDEMFLFTCNPYYLRLHLPGKLRDVCTYSSFDANSGEFEFKYKKVHPGEHFEDLALITKLMCPKIDVEEGQRKISIITNCSTEAISSSDAVANKYTESISGSDELTTNIAKYGFAMLGCSSFNRVSSEFRDVIEVNPVEVSLSERHKQRLQLEQGKFDSEYYLADLFDCDMIKELMIPEAPWSKLQDVSFTDDELDFLKDLQNIEYELKEDQINYCHNCLLDILYAYCYDQRTTHFEGTCESGWTVSKISASLCWLDGFNTPKAALVTSYRRCVIYPLYRNFELCERIFKDLKDLLRLGEKFIIRCLIEIHGMFLASDSGCYALNDLFIKHYVRYIMKWDKEAWKNVVSEVNDLVINKGDLGLNLQEIEESAKLGNMLSVLQIKDDDSDDSSVSDSESDSSSSVYTCSDSSSDDATDDTSDSE